MNRLDHLVVAAATLQQGVDYVRAQLGVEVPAGGFHQTMGTHNHLMQIGDGTFLEIIAIDPDAAPPSHPRWFGLDDMMMRASLQREPRLITWVMNTDQIMRLKRLAGFDIGMPTGLCRNDLRWQIGLTDDGRLLAHGLLPYIIEWHSDPHPAQQMVDLGCHLVELEIHHHRIDWISGMLKSIDAQELVSLHQLDDHQSPFLRARIETPIGERVLSSEIRV